MIEQDRQWIEEGGRRNVTVACGGPAFINICNVAGYCHCAQHRGFVTQSVLEGHDCINKGCNYFEKLDESPFWKIKQLHEQNLANIKAKEAKRKQRLAEEQAKRYALIDEYKQYALMLIARYNYPITIVSLKEKDEIGREVVIYFVSESKKNDTYTYRDIAVELRWKYPKVKFMIRRIIKSDGTCATVADLPKGML
jgi:hypothetical protein